MMNILYLALLLLHGIHLVAADCAGVEFKHPSTAASSNPEYTNGAILHVEVGGWSSEDIKECLGEAGSYSVWLVSEWVSSEGVPYSKLIYEGLDPRNGYIDDLILDISKDNLKWSPYHLELKKGAEKYDFFNTKKAVSGGFKVIKADDTITTSYSTTTITSTTSVETLTTTSTSTSTSSSSAGIITRPATTVIITQTASPTTTSSTTAIPEKTGLGTGAKAGIGVGVAAGVIGIAAGAYILLLLRRRRRARQVMPMISGQESGKYTPPGPPEMHDELPGSLPVSSQMNDAHKRSASEMLGSLPVRSNPGGRRDAGGGEAFELP
ncbi:uncharacterized protein GIQ15_01155 [Arthroderma uncinatum]|uniref:uncharacterized protein n=1 Tax=Arthroderma uncinatum TaxID=74035 RepID=UPI00144A7072|nr:uncharacterized protein GIQ15_01155 [Arthroderma uncinatum]KAF3491638.1 hypothetical protein GIQ15_01155 [Arthroderma uncinatum]